MECAFNAAALRVRLDQMGDRQQLAFGASCSERLLHNYLAFLNDTGWGDIAPLRDALDLVWAFLCGRPYPDDSVKHLRTLCEAEAPDSDDFTSLYVSLAQDACFSICALLDFLLSSDVDKIVVAATYATDSVDLYVQEIEDMDSNAPDVEERILAHVLMQRELRKQKDDLEAIAQARILDASFFIQLKNSSSNEGKSNLDLP
jgi:hypothetical protein